MMGLTAQQADCLAFLRSYQRQKGIAPSYAEITEALSLSSKSHAHRLVITLVDRGHIQMMRGRARSISFIEPQLPEHLSESLARVAAKVGRSERELLIQAVERLIADRGAA